MVDRRSLLIVAGMGTAFATAPTITLAQPATNRAAWDAAMAEYRIAKAAYDRADPEGEAIEIFADEYVDARDVLMAMPAPDRAALRWKLDYVFGVADTDDRSMPAYSKDFVAQTLKDYQRLLGDA